MLARDIVKPFRAENFEVVADQSASVRGFNDIVNESTLGRDHWIGKAFRVFLRVQFHVLAGVQNLHGTLGTHDGHLGTRPGVVGIATQVLARHDIISASVRLSRNYLIHAVGKDCVRNKGKRRREGNVDILQQRTVILGTLASQ